MDGSATSDLDADQRADEPTLDFPPVRAGYSERATYTDPSGYTEPVAFAAPAPDSAGAVAGGNPDGGATVAALREQTGNWPRVGGAAEAGAPDGALRESTGSWSQVGSAEAGAPDGALRESTGSWSQVGGDSAASAAPDGGGAALRESTGSWPRISDYWPDAPHRMGPAADYDPGSTARAGGGPTYPQEPAPTRLISPPPPPRRPWLRILLSALAALVFLGGSVVALTRLVTRQDSADPGAPTAAAQPPGQVGKQGVPSPPVSIEPSPSATVPSSAPAATATALPFTSGTFELASDVTELNLTVVELGNEPFQVTTPEDSGLTPRASIDGDTVKLVAQADNDDGSGRIDVRLNNRIAWALRLTGGVRNGTYTLAGANLRRIDLLGGAAQIEMALPSQKDTIPIRMSGGVNTWIITTAREVPVRVLLRRGGGEVVLNGRRDRGVDKNTTLRARVDDSNAGGLDIDAVAGLGKLTVSPADSDT